MPLNQPLARVTFPARAQASLMELWLMSSVQLSGLCSSQRSWLQLCPQLMRVAVVVRLVRACHCCKLALFRACSSEAAARRKDIESCETLKMSCGTGVVWPALLASDRCSAYVSAGTAGDAEKRSETLVQAGIGNPTRV